MKKISSIALILLAIFTLVVGLIPIGWPNMPDTVRWIFRGLAILGSIALLVILRMLIKEVILKRRNAVDAKKGNPNQGISAHLESLMLIRDKLWIGGDIVISSNSPNKIAVKEVKAIIWLPLAEGKFTHQRCDMQTLVGDQLGVISSQCDLKITLHHSNDSKMVKQLIDYIGEHPCKYIPTVHGKIIITTKELTDIENDISETSVIASVLRSNE